ncbi:MAG: glycosyltransferase [Bacteroidota bacterium]
MNNLVEVILPIYNPSNVVYEAIDTVINQTFRGWHLTIVDDCSPLDISSEIQKRYGGNERISFKRLSNNLGAAGARNLIVNTTDAKYIALLDQDDLWLPEKLALQVETLEKASKNIGAVHGDIQFIDKLGQLQPGKADQENLARKRAYWGDDNQILLRQVFLASNIRLISSMISREAFNNVGQFDQATTGDEDWEFWVRFSKSYGIAYISEDLIHRRIHDSNVSKTKGKRRNIDSLDVLYDIHSRGYDIPYPLFREKEYRIYATIVRFLRNTGDYLLACSYIFRYILKRPYKLLSHLKLTWYLLFGKRPISG